MANAKTLAHFDSKLKTSVVVDASPFALGVVLVQGDRVVAYEHRGLTDIKCRYSQTERDAVAIVWACT